MKTKIFLTVAFLVAVAIGSADAQTYRGKGRNDRDGIAQGRGRDNSQYDGNRYDRGRNSKFDRRGNEGGRKHFRKNYRFKRHHGRMSHHQKRYFHRRHF